MPIEHSLTYRTEQRYYATLPDDERLAEAPAFLHAELSPHYEELRAIRRWRLR